MAKQFTLSQAGGQIMLCPPQYYKAPRIFRPCDGPVVQFIMQMQIEEKFCLLSDKLSLGDLQRLKLKET